VRRQKYFGWEQAFHFIWEDTDSDGIWKGDAASLAAEFGVSEQAADAVLDELRAKRLVEKLYTGTFFLSNWRESDEIGKREA
jgi:hypothetical protein